MNNDDFRNDDIAIIGVSAKFPGANDLNEFWQNLLFKKESIQQFTDQEIYSSEVPENFYNNKYFKYIKSSGIIKGIDLFDADFFNYSSREAILMDPQFRLMLECAWNVLEDSGYATDKCNKSIGVFAGAYIPSYLMNNLHGLIKKDFLEDNDYHSLFQNINDFLTSNIAYKINLKGPCITVQSLCTTALTAIHLGCQYLRGEECDMALAGAVHIKLPQEGYYYQNGGNESPDGHCRSFDIKANGSVPGNGLGMVMLKKLKNAIKDKDNIYAVIKGISINNDGDDTSKMSYYGVTINGQMEAMKKALKKAEIDPSKIKYLELTGVGTEYADRLELTALSNIYKSTKNHKYLIGSVRPNIGHLGVASGIASLMKVILALRNGQIPPSINFKQFHPKIRKNIAHFMVNDELYDWNNKNNLRRAAINTFGGGGTNAHLILEEAPILLKSKSNRKKQLITLSAGTSNALNNIKQNLKDYLCDNKFINIADVAYTLNIGRKTLQYKCFFVVKNKHDFINKLSNDQTIYKEKDKNKDNPLLTFLFPGFSEALNKKGEFLYKQEYLFRQQVDKCAIILEKELGYSIIDLIFNPPRKGKLSENEFKRPIYSGPYQFIYQYALAKMFIEWGVIPNSMIGFGISEYVVACISNVIKLEDILVLIAKQAFLIEQLSEGKIIVDNNLKRKSENTVKDNNIFLPTEINFEILSLLGEKDANKLFQSKLASQNVDFYNINFSYALSSRIMTPIINETKKYLSKINFSDFLIPYISSVTGEWITHENIHDAEHWVKILLMPVYFHKSLKCFNKQNILLEINNKYALTPLISNNNTDIQNILSTSVLGEGENDIDSIYSVLGQLWSRNYKFDWEKYYCTENLRRISLPTYPFEHKSYWYNVNKENSIDYNKIRSNFKEEPHERSNFIEDSVDDNFEAPRTEFENAIFEIWKALFGKEKIGINEKFLELGGNSLTGTMFINRIRLKYEVSSITLANLFENPTIASFASFLGTKKKYSESQNSLRRSILSEITIEKSIKLLEDFLVELFSKLLKISRNSISPQTNLKDLPIKSICGHLYISFLHNLEIPVYDFEITSKKNINQLAVYLYNAINGNHDKIDSKTNILKIKYNSNPIINKNDKAIFVLSTPRSGSTLFRLMLAGHSKLFCPPELKLLKYETMAQLSNDLPDHLIRHGGIVKSFSKLFNDDDNKALDYITELIKENFSTKEVYKIIQTKIKPRILVDKSPDYSENIDTLFQAERKFNVPKYIYLIRHPYSSIESYVRERVFAISKKTVTDPYEYSENLWANNNNNILKFLESIDQNRYLLIKFEELVQSPQNIMKKVCVFLDIGYEDSMIMPYSGDRMIDGIGDPNIFNHSQIDSSLANVWKKIFLKNPLKPQTVSIANQFRYELPNEKKSG